MAELVVTEESEIEWTYNEAYGGITWLCTKFQYLSNELRSLLRDRELRLRSILGCEGCVFFLDKHSASILDQ